MDPGVLLLLISVGLLVLLLTSRRRQQREQRTLQGQLVPGAEVMTGGGLFATIVSLDDDIAVLETGPGQYSRWDRRAIARLLSVPDGPGAGAGEIYGDELGDAASGDDETVASSGPVDDPDRGNDDPGQGNDVVSGDDIGSKETGQSRHG